jgi:hypothetical protein
MLLLCAFSTIALVGGVMVMLVDRNIALGLILGSVPLLLIGTFTAFVGYKRLSMPDN